MPLAQGKKDRARSASNALHGQLQPRLRQEDGVFVFLMADDSRVQAVRNALAMKWRMAELKKSIQYLRPLFTIFTYERPTSRIRQLRKARAAS